MATQLITCIGVSGLALLIWTLSTLLGNYAVARRIGLPIVVSPITPLNIIWLLSYRVFPPVLLLKRLPFGLGRWARCTYTSWTFDDKCALHDEVGDLFCIVSPGSIEVVVADRKAANDVFARRKDFIKPAVIYDELNVFGPNLITIEGDDWQRHRRLTAPSFNEKISSVVWAESLRQARDMLNSWTVHGAHGTFETVKDIETMALHVLTCAGYGVSYSFNEGVRKLQQGHTMTYRDSLSLCLRNIFTFSIIPKQYLSFKLLPNKLRQVGQAVHEFQSYIEEHLAHERSQNTRQRNGPGNLMSALVQASKDAEKASLDGKVSKSLGLSDKEIFGNVFIYNLAGHETTANAISMALVLLAAHPHHQDWLGEEVREICDPSLNSLSWEYEKSFPELRRCLAVMLETLRLFGSLPLMPRATGSHSQEISSQGRSYVLPPKTFVTLNLQALHTKSQHWGSDALTWDPKRWIMSPAPANENGHLGLESQRDNLITPQRGTFVPWADGHRKCPGQKFSQVEFVAVMATFFAKHRVRPVLQPGQSEEDANRMLVGMVEGSNISAITLQMQEPRKVALRWELKRD